MEFADIEKITSQEEVSEPILSRLKLNKLVINNEENFYEKAKSLSLFDYQIVVLYYKYNLTQIQLSKLFGATQAAISRRLSYGIVRAQNGEQKPWTSDDDLLEKLQKILPSDLVFVAFYLFKFKYHTLVSRAVGLSQSSVSNKVKYLQAYLRNYRSNDIELNITAKVYYNMVNAVKVKIMYPNIIVVQKKAPENKIIRGAPVETTVIK